MKVELDVFLTKILRFDSPWESEGDRTFQISATRFWNSLPNEIKSSSSLEILKKSLYKYFLDYYKDVHHFTIA